MAKQKIVQAGIANLEGARLYYELAGEGDCLVLVHAGIADRRMWDDQFPVFARHFRVLRYDMRGFGNSAMAPGSFSHRRDLHRLLRFLGIEKAGFLGASMGGATVIDFALEHPEMIDSLVLVCSALSGYPYRGEPSKMVQALIAARKAGDFLKAAELQVCIWVDGPARTAEQVDSRVRERVHQMSYDSLSSQGGFLRQTGFVAEQGLKPSAARRLGGIAAPALVIIGEQDEETNVLIADNLAANIRGARKVMIRDTAHFPNMEKPAEFNRVVLSFLRKGKHTGEEAGGKKKTKKAVGLKGTGSVRAA
jgi:pimeloyl-ACP methyl ester carboxylesterase